MRSCAVLPWSLSLALTSALALASVSPGGVRAAEPDAATTRNVLSPTRDVVELWVNGNAAFRAGRYDEAASAYERLLAGGVDDGALHFNLANTYLRRGELARAIASYLAAQARMPRNEDVEANLRFARQRVQDAVAPPEPSAAMRAFFFWHYAFSRRELLGACAVVSACFWLALGLAVIARKRPWRYVAAALGVGLTALAPSVALRYGAPTTVAVVDRAELPVYSGIGDTNVVRFRLHAGAEALVMGGEEGWLRLRLPDGKQGWVPASGVIAVEL